MKKISTLFFALLLSAALVGQNVPNSGFENWTDENTAVNWNSSFNVSFPLTIEGMQLTIVMDYNSVSQSTQAHSGSYAAQVKSQEASAQLYGIPVYPVQIPGIMQLGQFNTQALQDIDFENMDASSLDLSQYLYGGIAFNQIPEKVTAWVTYVSGDQAAPDTMRAGVLLTRWNNGQREVVAQGDFIGNGDYTSYTQIEIPVAVKEGMEGVTPDTMNIIFSNSASTVNESTLLTVDDVEVVVENGGDDPDTPDTTAIFELSSLPVFSVRPNPTSEWLSITPAVNTDYAARLYDVNGKLVWEGLNLQGDTKVDVRDLTKGVYFLQVKQNGLVRSDKVVVR